MSRLITSAIEIPDAPCYVLSNDRFMSGWGYSKGKINTLIFPCESWEEAQHVKDYAESRTDQNRVRVVYDKPRLKNDTHTYSLATREWATAWYPRRKEEV